MAQNTVLGILPADSVQTAIDNFVEADFDQKDISLVMLNQENSRRIIDDSGPLKAVSIRSLPAALIKLKLKADIVQKYTLAVKKGDALLAVSAKSNEVQIIKQMLSDYSGKEIIII